MFILPRKFILLSKKDKERRVSGIFTLTIEKQKYMRLRTSIRRRRKKYLSLKFGLEVSRKDEEESDALHPY